MNLVSSLLRPIQAFRTAYLPLVMVYFAYGALGLIDVTRDLWIKETADADAVRSRRDRGLADLALDREDGVRRARRLRSALRLAAPRLHSDRRDRSPRRGLSFSPAPPAAGSSSRVPIIFMFSARCRSCIGTVIQDVVADAMSTEVVSRVDAAGKPVPEDNVRAELGMVQVLGRLSLSAGILAVAGLSGWVAGLMSRESVFLLGLVHPRDLDHRCLPDQVRNRGAARDRLAHPRRRACVRRGRRRARRSAAFRSRRKSSSRSRWA